ncbi:hypothetical protein SSP35_05_02380 [Streptomyces sp. NBRC 110611]|uniref:hypothetical protein n=1 Tax=Streptomyces sp. NBRC 110611 TaxID=1621259 RepID=UPI00082D3E62|nr:hypothetical protein [Streptomyces sp. NBRC 110611]GAU67671.1 hypothetical protein SSP35_05_02380 [Streptomyces sp. NBRC 110611]
MSTPERAYGRTTAKARTVHLVLGDRTLCGRAVRMAVPAEQALDGPLCGVCEQEEARHAMTMHVEGANIRSATGPGSPAAYVAALRSSDDVPMPAPVVEWLRQIVEAAAPAKGTDGKITYDDARRIRREAVALDAVRDELVLDAYVSGTPALQIADDLLLTSAYVHRIVKNNPWSAVWRAERLDGEQWVLLGDEERGAIERPTGNAARVAERLLPPIIAKGFTGVPLRVLVWRDVEGAVDEARAVAEYNPGAFPSHPGRQ